ncbi:Leucine-rich repeat [Sesbania bispinosa]|nr:Leucine-rich repeat [Sesbania bispinosa]
MFRSSLCLLFLQASILLCVGSNSHKNKCAETDREALDNLKHGFIDKKDILSSWRNGVDCCKWKGVSCHNITGHVTIVDLQSSSYSQQLGGKIPECIGSLGQLIELKLSDNKFVSLVPHTLANLSNLQTLDLGWSNHYLVANDLEWVSHLHNLRYLDLSNMNLSRAVDWLSSISKIPSLSQLHLSDCFLPQVNLKSTPQLNSSTSLTHLDLSINSLHHVPDGFANLTSLQYLHLSYNELEVGLLDDKAILAWKGENREYGKNLGLMTSIDLSYNQLKGEIPQRKIPLGTQLQSFDASTYIGNDGLCGPPLSEHCPGDVISPTGSPDKHVIDGNEDKVITSGFYISLGLGFCLGFWGVCGTLVIKTSWRHAYFQFFNKMNDWIHVTVAVFTARMTRRFQLQE